MSKKRTPTHNVNDWKIDEGGVKRRLGFLAAGLAAMAVVGVATKALGSDDGDEYPQLGTVEEFVVSETVTEDGVEETLTITIGEPAGLAFEWIDRNPTLVAPWEYQPSENCQLGASPLPAQELDRGVGMQGGVHAAFFVARFASEGDAREAQSAVNRCYADHTPTMAADLGRTPGSSELEQRQELAVERGRQLETRISPPLFGDDGPVVFSARTDTTLAVLVDLDNGFDEYDGPSIATDLLLSVG